MSILNELKSWKTFEDLVAEIFQNQGWDITYKPSEGPDQGRDILCKTTVDENLSKVELSMLIQCKFYKKSVSEKDVGSILDIATSYGVNVYLIAAKSRLTSNLQNLLHRLDKKSSIRLRSLVGYEIENLIINNENLFQKYCPKGYQRHLDGLQSINEHNLTKLYSRVFGKKPTEEEINKLMMIKYHNRVISMSTYRNIWNDKSIRNHLDQLYQRLLKRTADPVGLIRFGMLIKKAIPNADIVQLIKSSPEYIAQQAKIRFHFNDHPISVIEFERFDTTFLDWWSYHRKHFNGKIEIRQRTNKTRCVTLEPNKVGNSFRLAFPKSYFGLPKKNLRIRFRGNFDFEIFAYVTGTNGLPYFITIDPGPAGESTSRSEGIDYAWIHVGAKYRNGNWHTVTKNLSAVLKRLFGHNVRHINYFCFHVKGPFTVDYLEIY